MYTLQCLAFFAFTTSQLAELPSLRCELRVLPDYLPDWILERRTKLEALLLAASKTETECAGPCYGIPHCKECDLRTNVDIGNYTMSVTVANPYCLRKGDWFLTVSVFKPTHNLLEEEDYSTVMELVCTRACRKVWEEVTDLPYEQVFRSLNKPNDSIIEYRRYLENRNLCPEFEETVQYKKWLAM